jgi:hypothetical protein
VISELEEEAKSRSPENAVRIVPYFCSASSNGLERPDYQTIIRSLAQKLSWNPDYTVAQSAHDVWDECFQGNQSPSEPGRWQELLDTLISEIPEESVVVFLVDALDECANTEAIGDLLRFMNGALQKSTNIHVLFSSRQHVSVTRYLGDSLLYDIDLVPETTTADMTRFIQGEIDRRRPTEFKEGESIFCKFVSHPRQRWKYFLNNSRSSQAATPRLVG